MSTHAELKHDPRAALPHSFTVCSTIMLVECQSYFPSMFFNILDNQFEQIMGHSISLWFCPYFCPFALISHNTLPLNFALALAIYVAFEATFMAKFEGKGLCETRAKGQK